MAVSDGELESIINLEVALQDVYEDEGTYQGEGEGDGNESEFWGHPIFQFSASTLQVLTGELLLPGHYAVVETGPYFVDLEPVILESNGSWLPTTESDYVNMVPGYYSDADNLWQSLQLLMDEPVGFLSGVYHDDNETLPPEHNESEIGAFEIMLSNNRILENEAPGLLWVRLMLCLYMNMLIAFIISLDPQSSINFELLMGHQFFRLEGGILFTNDYLDYEYSSEQTIVVGAFGPDGFIMERSLLLRWKTASSQLFAPWNLQRWI